MDSSQDNPALQLFHLELQELMEQVGLALTALLDSSSSAEFKRLCRSVRLIHQGAVQMKLEAIEQRTAEFLKILLPVSNVPEDDLSSAQLEALTRLFQELQTVDIMSSSSPQLTSVAATISTPTQTVMISPEVSFSELGDANASVSGISSDMRQVLLQQDIADVMTQLEQGLEAVPGEFNIAKTVTKIHALMGWGEVLNWPELVALAQALAQGVETHPDAAQTIVSIGLMGLRSLHRFALNEAGMTLDIPKTNAVAEAFDSQNPFVFETAHQFIWQSQQAIFALDSTAIAETLIPLQTQVNTVDHQRFLQWNHQQVPIVSLTMLLTQQWQSTFGRNPVAESIPTSSQGPVIVISTAQGMIALDIEMEQFIRMPELRVIPIPLSPTFYLGWTTTHEGGNQRSERHLIDVLELVKVSQPVVEITAQTETVVGLNSTHVNDVLGGLPKTSSPARMPSTWVLVVDDSRTIRYLLQRIFEPSKYSVIIAQDGLEAIQKLQQHPEIALMISDVEMPKLNGFELLSRCRGTSQWKDLPIIILSQCSTEQHRQFSRQFGANAYLPKPFDNAIVLSTVASVLRDTKMDATAP